MDINELISKLGKNGAVFESLFKNISKDQIHWKPSEQKWSMLEIACHLLDEEKEDFRQRIDFTLHKPGEQWPPINPHGWVTVRDYAGKNFKETVSTLHIERKKSAEWLNGLKNPNWENSYQHPVAGELNAKQLLANWLAHDLLHIRQITAMNFMYLQEKSSPFKLDYAGNW